jgi:hypothetical protein
MSVRLRPTADRQARSRCHRFRDDGAGAAIDPLTGPRKPPVSGAGPATAGISTRIRVRLVQKRQADKDTASLTCGDIPMTLSQPRAPLALMVAVQAVVSGSSLVVEIVAGRMLAPYVGMSLYTWTSIIAVVLAGFSVGHWWGGHVAERPARQALVYTGWVLLAAAVTTGCALVLLRFAGRACSRDGDTSGVEHRGADDLRLFSAFVVCRRAGPGAHANCGEQCESALPGGLWAPCSQRAPWEQLAARCLRDLSSSPGSARRHADNCDDRLSFCRLA